MKTLIQVFSTQITAFNPTHVVFNDPLTLKITSVLPKRDKFKRVAMVHTAEQLPFGPYCNGVPGHCISPKAEDELLREVDGIWVVSKALQDYAKTYGNLDTTFLVHSPLTYLDTKTGGFPSIRNNVNKYEVGMINPCPHKGLSILLALAKRLPDIKFVVWKSWGTGPEVIEKLRSLPNMQ